MIDWNTKKVLVTGGNGFVGTNLCSKLDKLSVKISELQAMSSSNEDRLNKLEKRNSGGSRF